MSTTTPDLLSENGTDSEESKAAIPVPAKADPASLFRYSTWLHVGGGSEDCDEVDERENTNSCGDRGHFHAWCRLPNPLQHAEIRNRALAAKARKIRQLRDPESDAFAVLQEEFDGLERQGEAAREKLVEELIAADFFRDYYEAMLEARQIDDPDADAADDEDPPKLYEHIEDDQQRLVRLDAMPAEQRPKDEYETLKRHIAGYNAAVAEAQELRQKPKRDALEGLSIEQLLEQLRDKRIDNEAMQEFSRVYEIHEWLSCTYRQPGGPAALADLSLLENAAPEVIAGLQAAFADLKRTSQAAQGN